MRALILHNQYSQSGGEDTTVRNDCEILRQHGHEVLLLKVKNPQDMHSFAWKDILFRFFWSRNSYFRVSKAIKEFHPDVVHVHNTFFLLSPSVYSACRAFHIPVVQSLHNYRFLCAAGTFFRDGKICQDCTHHILPTPGIIHHCYRSSGLLSGLIGLSNMIQKYIWKRDSKINIYLAPTDAMRKIFIRNGIQPKKIIVRPHACTEPTHSQEEKRLYALYVGRLSPEKGISTLVEAWQLLGDTLPLKIIGSGPQASYVQSSLHQLKNVEYLGAQSRESIDRYINQAKMLIFPSIWLEPFGLAITEAYAHGVPVIASKLGSISSLVKHHKTGLLFSAGNSSDLVKQVRYFLDHPVESKKMSHNAKQEYMQKYSAEVGYASLIRAYTQAMKTI